MGVILIVISSSLDCAFTTVDETRNCVETGDKRYEKVTRPRYRPSQRQCHPGRRHDRH